MRAFLKTDGSVFEGDVQIGKIIRSSRSLQDANGTVGEGWAFVDCNGDELFWSLHWGDTFSLGCHKSREKRAAQKPPMSNLGRQTFDFLNGLNKTLYGAS